MPNLAAFTRFISIHALTRSATRGYGPYHSRVSISIHALTRSATACSFDSVLEYNNFNPRTHEECDAERRANYECEFYFNPRTHEECDANVVNRAHKRVNFNPRTHEECDTAKNIVVGLLTDFNPRTHEECDLWFYYPLNPS